MFDTVTNSNESGCKEINMNSADSHFYNKVQFVFVTAYENLRTHKLCSLSTQIIKPITA
jgi:aspartate 1-decarboxylase